MAKMGFEKQPFRAKYGNEPVDAVVDGKRIHFLSKLEYRWAQYLDFLKTIGEILDWFYEFHTFKFDDRDRPPYEFTPDFLVRKKDNTFEYHETKGMLQKYDLDKLKIVFTERPYVKITVVFWRKPKLSVQKKNKLERYAHHVIYRGEQIVKKVPNVDLS